MKFKLQFQYIYIYSSFCHIELDDVLNRPYTTEEDAKRVTTQYIRFLVRYQRKLHYRYHGNHKITLL